MKLKKLIVVFLLITLFVAQISWITFSGIVYASDNQADGKFHYDQLDAEAKVIYNALLHMHNNGILQKGNQSYDLVDNGYFTEEQVKEYEKGSSKLNSAMNAARYAFYADYPEIFYVNFQYLTIRITKDANNNYHANLGSGRHANYYIPGFNNENEVNSAIEEFDGKVNEIVEKANNVEVEENENRIVKQIKLVHNEIIHNAGYRLESDCTAGYEGFIGTPYGALVKGQAVCEGYARAFKTVLDKLGINCILVQGTHQSEGSAEVPHMWNYVEIEKDTVARSEEKVWYAVDATLDDPFTRAIRVNEDEERLPGSDIVEGFENTRFCLVGTETMNKEHIALETVEAAGNYVFKYPELNVEDYGIDTVVNENGLLVKFKQEGTETEEYKAGDYYISYNGKGYNGASEEGKYILTKTYYYRPGDEEWDVSPWAYLIPDPDLYAGGFSDRGDHIYLTLPNSEYVEFAVTTLAPGDYTQDPKYLSYLGDESDFVAKSGKLYNPNGTYKGRPYIKSQSPAPVANLTVGPVYHVDVSYHDDLVLANGATEAGYRMESTGHSGVANSTITNFKFDGKNRITFDLKFSQMYADDGATYRIYLTGLVGKNSGKEPLEITYSAVNLIGCAGRMNQAQNWSVFGRPTLIENEDLSMEGWQTKDGKPVSDKLKSRIALVTTKTTNAETNTMNDLIEDTLGDKQLVQSETYNISLNVCKLYVVKTGHKLRISLGFPKGYGPEDAGVTFKAYHFMRDDNDNITGVEEIPCVVTQYGLIITCDSFSPFAVAVVENDGTEVSQDKALIVSATDGGVINGANREEGNIITLKENESAELSVIPDNGYEIESINVCGKTIEVTNRDLMNITVNYDDIKDGNCIVDAKFVAKTVIEEEVSRGELAVVQTAVPAEITMPSEKVLAMKSTLKITPTVTETPGIQTYQWYKDDVRLEGKTNKVLEINNVTAEDQGNYVLKVTSTVDTSSEEVTSSPCKVTIANFITSIEKSDNEKVYPGSEIELDVKVKDLLNVETGLIALTGQLEYDEDVLERLDIKGVNGWSLEDGFNEENLKFLIDNNDYVNENSTMFTMKFKVKETVTAPVTTLVKIKNIIATNSVIDIDSNDAELEINIEEFITELTSDVYTVEETDVTRIPEKTTFATFKTNVDTNQTLILKDQDGNVITDENTLVGTGMKLQVGTDKEYSLVVTGDTDGNGKITVTDLAQIKLHIIAKEMLSGSAYKAADMNSTGDITVTDLAQIKLIIIGLDKK